MAVDRQDKPVRSGMPSRGRWCPEPADPRPLKKEGLLTRDSRVKERKKYGQKGLASGSSTPNDKRRSQHHRKGKAPGLPFFYVYSYNL